MSVHLVTHKDPYRIQLDVARELVPQGKTVYEMLYDRNLVTYTEDLPVRSFPYVICVNGEPFLQEKWNTILCDNDVIQIAYLPKGGGGGSNMSNIIIGIIAAVMAYFTFGMSLAVSAAIGVGAAVGMSLITGAVAVPSTNLQAGKESTSPTYNLNAQGNSARLLEAIPRVYGTFRTFPDLASQPYSEYQGNEQYLYQLFCVSLGDVDIDLIEVDDTPLSNFTDATVEIIKPGQAVTLFPDNVTTSESVQGLEMVAANNPNYHVLGPFSVSTDAVNFIGIDVAAPRGVGQVDPASGQTISHSVSFKADYRDVAGGAWTTLIDQTLTFATSQPQLLSFKVAVPLGRYEVQIYRTSSEDLSNNAKFDLLQWSSMRGYAPSTRTYGNVTLIAVAMRATNALNSSTARKFAVTSTAKLQAWNPIDGWGAAARTSSIAWAAADILRNQDYGRGMTTSRINIQNLYRLDAVWAARGDKFNGVFDTTSQLWAALTTVLRCGRAIPMFYAGVIDFIRDEPQTVVTAQFNPARMVKGSFSVTYQFHDEETPDHVIVEYTNPTTWKTAEVTGFMPGSLMRNPFRVTLKGCTDRNQAYREAMSMAAGNRDRRKTIEFTTLKEGLVPQYNGLIRVNHDVPQWGYSGRVYSFNPANGKLMSSEPIPHREGIVNAIAFRRRDGSEHGPFTFVRDPSLSDIDREFGCIVQGTVAELSAIYISDGDAEDYTHYIAGPTEQRGQLALVLKARPDSEGRVAITAINNAESVHTAENGGIVPPPPPESTLPTVDSAPIIDSVDVVYTVVVGEQNIIATGSRTAIYYEFQARPMGGGWQSLGTSDRPSLRASLSAGQWEVRVRGVSRVEGPWSTWAGTIEATSLPTARLRAFVATPKLFAIGLAWEWEPSTVSIAKSIDIYSGVTNVLGNATKFITLPYPASAASQDNLDAGEQRYYWARCTDTAGRVGPWFNNGTPIAQRSSTDQTKLTAALLGAIAKEQLTAELWTQIENAADSTAIYAAIDDERTARTTADTAIAQDVTTVRATANGAMAATQTNAQTIAKTNGDLAAMYTIKTQLTIDGIPYIAALGVGVENTGGVLTSTITMVADKFALLNPNSGTRSSPWLVVGNNTYIASAFIQKATIENALIGSTLKSITTVASGPNINLPVLLQDFNAGQTVYRGVNFSRVDNASGLYMQDVNTGVVVFQAGDLP